MRFFVSQENFPIFRFRMRPSVYHNLCVAEDEPEEAMHGGQEGFRSIGEGTFGVVLRHESGVAIKVSRTPGGQDDEHLINQARLQAWLGNHPNVVHFFGQTFIPGPRGLNRLAIAFECCLGDLSTYLKRLRQAVLPNLVTREDQADLSRWLIRWAKQGAAGMEFIHSQNVFHRDLALRNMLLSTNYVVKICDFGLARIGNNDQDFYELDRENDMLMDFEITAPEAFLQLDDGTIRITKKSDVYSFGVALWEMFMLGEEPNSLALKGPNMSGYEFKASYRLPIPNLATPAVYDVMLRCWEAYSENRPSFSELQTILHHVSAQICRTRLSNFGLPASLPK